MRIHRIAPIILALMMLATGQAVGATVETFDITLEGNNQFVDGTSSGWGSGDWAEYPSGELTVWTTWFYCGSPDTTGQLAIDYEINLLGPEDDNVDFNGWVYLCWPEAGFFETGSLGPPPQPDENDSIVRHHIADFNDDDELIEGYHDLLDQYPEWLGIQIFADCNYVTWEWDNQWGIWNPILTPAELFISGTVAHEPISEPAILALLGLGAVGVLTRRRVRG
jgi:hypothetical protein